MRVTMLQCATIATMIMLSATPAVALRTQQLFLVLAPGPANNNVTIKAVTKNAAGVKTTATLTFMLANADVVNASAKAAKLAAQFSMLGNVTAAAALTIVTVDVAAGQVELVDIEINPGKGERDEFLAPIENNPPKKPPSAHMNLNGNSTGAFAAQLEISGPNGGVFAENTDGASPSSVLAAFASQINATGNFRAVVFQNRLIVNDLTDDNGFSVFFEDPGFDYEFGISTVPVLSDWGRIVFGFALLAVAAVASRRRAVR